MTSVVRSTLGAVLLLTGASAAMAQTATPTQPRQAAASTATVASNNAVAGQPVQTGALAATAANNAAANQAKKPRRSNIDDNSDPNGGHDPNSTAAARAFFTPIY